MSLDALHAIVLFFIEDYIREEIKKDDSFNVVENLPCQSSTTQFTFFSLQT